MTEKKKHERKNSIWEVMMLSVMTKSAKRKRKTKLKND